MNMIIYNSKKINHFSEKCITEYEGTENFKITKCPHCGDERIIKWGKYTRNIIYYKNNKKYEDTIEIKRIRCNNCKKTQSIIPVFLVPYKLHTVEYITEVMEYKIIKKVTYDEVSEKYETSRQLVKYWEDCFEEHYTRIMVTLREKKRNKIIRIIKRTLYEFICRYYEENRKIYMMYVKDKSNRPILKWAPT